jgi:DNA-binding transcriptional LysR family regulator
MELRHLRYFVAVADEKHFTRAAKRLHIAQPPLSRQIQLLEEELGVELIEKGTRPVKLTEAGAFFHVHAQELLAKAAELKTMTQRVGKIERTLSIGFVASTLYGLLPRIVRCYRAQHPHVEVTFNEMTTMQQIQALKDGVIDVGFGRVKSEDVNIRRIVLREERLIVALPAAHPRAASSDAMSLVDLQSECLLVYPKSPRPSFADQVLSVLSERSITPQKIVEVRELQIAIGLVAAGQGVAIVPDSVQGMRRDDVVFRPLTDRHAVSPVMFSVRKQDRSEELQKMLAVIYDVYDAAGISYIREAL